MVNCWWVAAMRKRGCGRAATTRLKYQGLEERLREIPRKGQMKKRSWGSVARKGRNHEAQSTREASRRADAVCGRRRGRGRECWHSESREEHHDDETQERGCNARCLFMVRPRRVVMRGGANVPQPRARAERGAVWRVPSGF